MLSCEGSGIKVVLIGFNCLEHRALFADGLSIYGDLWMELLNLIDNRVYSME